MNKYIVIPYDYTHTDCVSHFEAKEEMKNGVGLIYTNCLSFFQIDNYRNKGYNVIIVKKDGGNIILRDLILNCLDEEGNKLYTNKSIRLAHNVLRIFMAGGLEFDYTCKIKGV